MGQVFYAQDEAGNQRRVIHSRQQVQTGAGLATPADVYKLEDGTPVRRVDNDTFQIAGTGAYITIVRA